MDAESLKAGFVMGILIAHTYVGVGLLIYIVKRIGAKSVS